MRQTAIKESKSIAKPEVVKEESDFTLECPITGDMIINPAVTSCGHIFEENEIKDWINRGQKKDAKANVVHSCPVCQTEITLLDVHPIYQLKAILPFFKKQKAELEKLKAEKVALMAESDRSKIIIQSSSVNAEMKDKKVISRMEQNLNTATKTAAAITTLAQQQLKNIEVRKSLIETTVPKIKTAYKKLAFIRRRINELEKSFNTADEKALIGDQFLELEVSTQDQCKKYRKIHEDLARKTYAEIIVPYLKNLEELDMKIEKTKNDLSALKTAQTQSISKAATRGRLAPILSLSLFGGTRKIKSVTDISVSDVKKAEPIKPRQVEKPVISAIERGRQTRILIDAFERKDYGQILIALQNGANPNIVYNEKGTLLLQAIGQNDPLMINIFLENNPQINLGSGTCKDTPLIMAIYNKNAVLVFTLLEMGADPRIADSYEKTSIHWASERLPGIMPTLIERRDELDELDRKSRSQFATSIR